MSANWEAKWIGFPCPDSGPIVFVAGVVVGVLAHDAVRAFVMWLG